MSEKALKEAKIGKKRLRNTIPGKNDIDKVEKGANTVF